MSVSRLRQKGDTIIEVLICMAIVSGSLATSYGIARKSLARVREAEERSQSVRLAEQQIERFKQYLKTNPNITTAPPPAPPGKTSLISVSPDTAGFCVYNNGSIYRIPATINGPTDPHCALNTQGKFYCDPPAPALCSGALTTAAVNAAGYNSTAAIVYLPVPIFGADGNVDQFYASSGRYTAVGDNTNARKFDVVVIPYRIRQ